MTRRARTGAQGGQAAVELIAVLPLAVAVAVAAGTWLAAGAASEAAGAAAHAGAVAILQDNDPEAAARQALGPSPGRATVAVAGRRVTVTVRPDGPVEPLERLLEATETADAGPGPTVPSSTTVIRGGDGKSARPREADDGASRPAADRPQPVPGRPQPAPVDRPHPASGGGPPLPAPASRPQPGPVGRPNSESGRRRPPAAASTEDDRR